MDDLEFEQTFEDVCDWMSEIQSTLNNAKYYNMFDNKFDCEDYLKEAIRLCNDWLKENEERYYKIRKAEEDEMNREFERSRL